jgi:hypothetical protein
MLRYQSAIFWLDYQDIEWQSEERYTADLSEVISWDLAINKWIWDKKIKVDVILRNIFDHQNPYFPIGASLDLRFYVQAELYFNFR